MIPVEPARPCPQVCDTCAFEDRPGRWGPCTRTVEHLGAHRCAEHLPAEPPAAASP